MSPSSLLGAAGEHYVMPQLLRRGFIAALAPVGVPIADIVITNDAGERACALQVKTRREIGSDAGWHRKADRKSVVSGKRVSVRVDLGGRRIIKKKNKTKYQRT